jgi:hypothetical protein
MAVYRFYWVGDDDKIRRADNVECASDEDARRIAAEYKAASPAIEVWLGERRIVKLAAPGSQDAELVDITGPVAVTTLTVDLQ